MPGPLTAMPPQPGQTPCPIHAYGLWRPGWRDRPVPGRNWIQQQRGRRRFRPESSTGGLTMQLQSRWAAHPVLGPARSRQRGSASPHHPAHTIQPTPSSPHPSADHVSRCRTTPIARPRSAPAAAGRSSGARNGNGSGRRCATAQSAAATAADRKTSLRPRPEAERLSVLVFTAGRAEPPRVARLAQAAERCTRNGMSDDTRQPDEPSAAAHSRETAPLIPRTWQLFAA